MSTTTQYVLTIGTTDFKINTPTSTENRDFQATLTKLSYNKGIYRPGEIFAVFNVPSTYTYAKMKSFFFGNEEEGTRIQASLRFNEETNTKIIAKNYYVFKMKPIFRRSSNHTVQTVELTICSKDKLMTLDKYCKAYTGRKLGIDIFKEGADQFTSVETNIETVSEDLQVISFEDSNKTSKRNEFIQPYLVQYNESFYDFLKRTANRCGEFLYYEEGKLHLGMTTSDKTNTDYATIASEYYYEDIQQGVLAVNDYAHNYLKASTPSDPIYDDPLASDEYLDTITKEYTTYSAQMYKHDKDAMAYICSALQGSNLAEIFGALSFQATFQAINAAVLTKTQNDTHYASNIMKWVDMDSDEKEKDFSDWSIDTKEKWDGKGENLRQFGTGTDQPTNISGTTAYNLLAKYYDLIRQLQQKACKNAVFLDFKDNPQDLKIGDLIKVDSTVFLVIEVKGSEEYVDGRYEMHQKVVGIQPYKKSDGNYIPIPPRLPDLIVRESQAQPATVAANFDPKKIGRVRIRFAWQNGTDDASPWVRVALPFATNGGGVKFKPEIGDEVMVSFIDGNVERPYVTGFLLNPNSNENWKALPDRSITSKNGHNITFTDGVDGSNFILNMVPVAGLIKSFVPVTDCPALFNSKGGLALTGGTVISDRYKLYEINMSTDNRSILIKSAMGDVTLNAFTGITISAPNGNINIAGKNVNISASNKVNITSGSAIRKRFFPNSGLGDNENLGKKFGYSAAFTFSDFFLSGFDTYVQKLANKFIDLTFIRTIIEVFTRPIEGTTKIKSFSFVQIEAGKGSTDFPAGTLKSEDEPFFPKLNRSIDAISSAIDSRIISINSKYLALFTALDDFKAISGDDDNAVNKNQDAIKFVTIRADGTLRGITSYTEDLIDWPERLKDKEFDATATENKVKDYMKVHTDQAYDHKPDKKDARYKNNNALFKADTAQWNDLWEVYYIGAKKLNKLDNQDKAQKRKEIVKKASALATAFADLKSAIDQGKADVKVMRTFKTEVTDAVKETFDDLNLLKAENIEENDTFDIINHLWDTNIKMWKRTAVWKLLIKVKNEMKVKGYTFQISDYDSTTNVLNASTWSDLVGGFAVKDAPVNNNGNQDEKGFGSSWASHIGNTAKNEWKTWIENSVVNPWLSTFSNFSHWKTGMEGKILLSDQASKTTIINANGAIETKPNQTASDKYIAQFKNKLKNIE